MSIAYRHLKGFMSVARCGSISRAAEELNVSQPALTQTIRGLEEIVGTPLFDRSAKGVTLTRAGEEFIVVSARLISEIDNALEDLRGFAEIRRGQITVAGLPSLTCRFLPHVVARFKCDYPNMNTVIFDGLANHIEEMVRRGQCDFALSCPVDPRSDLHLEPVIEDALTLICSSDHALAVAERVTWEEICKHKFIGLSHSSSTRTFVDRAFASIGRVVDPSYEVGHITTVGGIVAEGLGVSVVPKMTRALINQPGIVFRKVEEPVISRKICLVRRSDRSLSPASQILWNTILKYDFTDQSAV